MIIILLLLFLFLFYSTPPSSQKEAIVKVRGEGWGGVERRLLLRAGVWKGGYC